MNAHLYIALAITACNVGSDFIFINVYFKQIINNTNANNLNCVEDIYR